MLLKITALPVAVLVSLVLWVPVAVAHPHHRHHHHHHVVQPPSPVIEYVGSASNPAPVVSAPAAPPPVVFERTFPTYGNVGAGGIGDCTFAAAADWEIIQLGHIPPEAEVIADFNAASSRNEEAWEYWPRYGIGGVYAKVETSWPNTDGNLLSLLASYHTVIAQITVGSEYHAVVVDGSNATGPLLVTWGDTLQWTWAEWDARKIWIAVASLVRQTR